MDAAVQFLFTVVGSDEDVDRRPKSNPSLTEVHSYTLHTLIRDSARIGRDAGFLQLLFLAGATGHPIQQHSNLSDHHDLYKTLVPPCSCAEKYKSVVHIMWTNSSQTPGGSPNHIIPLVEEHPSDHSNSNSKLFCEDLGQTCLMWGKCSKSLEAHGRKVDWVICQKCQAWYHTICIGLSPKITSQDNFEFCCCACPSPEDDVIVLKHPLAVKRGVIQSQLRISDLQSAFPWNGVSDALMDFYIREMLPPHSNIACVGALTFTGITKVLAEDDDERVIEVHRSVNGKMDINNKSMVIFPCRTSGAWHWILVAVSPDLTKAFIMDSMSNLLTPYSNYTVKGSRRFLGVINDNMLTPVPVKVYQQTTDTNCGIHVLHNMTQLILHSLEGLKTLEDSFCCVTQRREILKRSHYLTGKCARQVYSTSRAVSCVSANCTTCF